MHIREQVESGKLRCPRTRQPLKIEGEKLLNKEGSETYSMPKGVPVLLRDSTEIDKMLAANPNMQTEYESPNLYQRIRKRFYKDYNSKAYYEAFKVIADYPTSALVLEIGGGPTRSGAHITNMNIGPFPNVDLVGDAHDLPYADESVDAICHAAVLEHVRDPIIAVREMHRVLKPGGHLFSSIPFMQGYHGYPDHYQNYTISGHQHLYESNGFEVIRAGAGQGPIMALTLFNSRFLLEYLPRGLNQIIGRPVQVMGLLLRPLDRFLENKSNNHVLASTTFLLARKL